LIREFNGSSIELGILCGKPFPISVIVIKKW
jgi:ribosomal protein L30E